MLTVKHSSSVGTVTRRQRVDSWTKNWFTIEKNTQKMYDTIRLMPFRIFEKVRFSSKITIFSYSFRYGFTGFTSLPNAICCRNSNISKWILSICSLLCKRAQFSDDKTNIRSALIKFGTIQIWNILVNNTPSLFTSMFHICLRKKI